MTDTRNDSEFEGILDGYFEKYFEEHPDQASMAGFEDGAGKFPQSSPAFVQRWNAHRTKTLAAMENLSPQRLSREQHLDRLAFSSQLRREMDDHVSGRNSMNPHAVDHVLHLYLHELQGFRSPKEIAVTLRSLLRQTPRFLDAAATLVVHPEPLWLQILDQSVAAAPSLLQAIEQFFRTYETPEHSSGSAQLLVKGAERAILEYQAQVHQKKPSPIDSFAVGPIELQRRVIDQLGLDYSLRQIEALALGEVARLKENLDKVCRKFGAGKTPEDIIEKERGKWNPGADLLELYRSETGRIATAFQEANAVTFPNNQSLEVKAVPDFMRHLFPTAAYTQPGPFAKVQRGIFWVNDLSLLRADQKEKQKERQQHFGLSLTCAHEAYPGHHLQFSVANRHPRKWRRIFAHAVFYEGWTLWCEQMMVDLKIDRSPWLRVQQLHDALWRAHRILVDLRMQTGRYSARDGVNHLKKHLGFTQGRAQADVNWYTSSPSVPMSYWLGRLENERLRRRLMAGRGWSLKKFNDWLLSFGTLPQSWIEKYGLD